MSILLLCRHAQEQNAVLQILDKKFGKAQIHAYAAIKKSSEDALR